MKHLELPFAPGEASGGTTYRMRPTPPEIVLDISRLVSRLLHPTPTGVDRVELAYARGLLARAPDRLSFSAVHPWGIYGRLDRKAVCGFLDHTEARWEIEGAGETWARRRGNALHWLWRLRPRPVPPPRRARILLQPSPNQLHLASRIAAKKVKEAARFICLVHDLIPVTHPEFARTGGAALHRQRIRTVETLADAILVNSEATRDALVSVSGQTLRDRPIRVAPLGVASGKRDTEAAEPSGRPYFLCIGTIEPRKNHLLLLNVWRSIVERVGPERAPLLLIAGRRGWENENIIDMLDRCTSLKGVVHELDRVPDSELFALVAGARALLMPSFAEGFGLPIAEALAAGAPVIASDLPAHREAGGCVPEFLDPLDGLAWREAVLTYADEHGFRRRAQLDRLTRWTPTRWDDHITTVLELAEEIAQC